MNSPGVRLCTRGDAVSSCNTNPKKNMYSECATGPDASGLPVPYPPGTGGSAQSRTRGTRRMSAVNNRDGYNSCSRGSPRTEFCAIVVLIAVSTALTGGCAGHASIHIASLDTKRISTTAPLIMRVTPDRCYYWVNERDELCIAMREDKRSLLGKRFGAEFRLSLVLEGLPAGSSRSYPMSQRTLRARHRDGFTHTRAASVGGIAAVWGYGKGRLHGRFRALVEQQSWSVLKGWGSNKKVFMVGDFTAVKDQQAGQRILTETETDGMERPPPRPTPRPVRGPPRTTKASSP